MTAALLIGLFHSGSGGVNRIPDGGFVSYGEFTVPTAPPTTGATTTTTAPTTTTTVLGATTTTTTPPATTPTIPGSPTTITLPPGTPPRVLGACAGATVAPSVARPRQTLRVGACGFAANSNGNKLLFSAPFNAGPFVADAAGNVDTLVTLPAGITAGTHTIVLEGVAPDGTGHAPSVSFTVVGGGTGVLGTGTGSGTAGSAFGGTLPRTGTNTTEWLLRMATAMLLLGFGLKVLRPSGARYTRRVTA